ncbi:MULTISPECIES: sensor histidine kinase [Paenibacillus]|uniref:sensor histidine kinase n=1 Tax=Paenibacillus TaxID=44249 RepID=UPI0022B92FE4|nr:HAMP domain-containing sensor histidine kinase [Paenibacillus caseinilyticus]MCZ8520297.1 HAMP domain-containing sensor histidine kinase [Paenibacillus caseinilyticus]
MIWLMILSMAAAGLLFCLWLRLKREIRALTAGLKLMRLEEDRRQLRVAVGDRDLEGLRAECGLLADRWREASVRAGRLDESRRRMLANLAHDIQTPLAGMLGYIESVREDSRLTEEQRVRYLDIASRKGRELSAMLLSFFELSKLESDDTPIRLQAVDLAELLPEWLLTLYPEFERIGLEPEVELPSMPALVWAEPGLMGRVAANLLSNALRYGASGGAVGVCIREEEEHYGFTVWDRGPGIPQSELPFIFERLYTSDPSRTRTRRGSGLGLAIVRRLVQRQQGTIEVNSVPHERTVFTVRLKRARE